MRVADTYLGNESEDAIASRLADADSATVVLSDTDRQRSRVRTETTDGQELGVVVGEELAGGDVLEADDGTLVVVELAAIDVLVIDIDGSDMSPTAALEVGHALGNRHWDMALRDGEALFPVPESRARMTAAVEEVLPAGVDTRFESVPPTTFDDTGDPHSADDHGHAHAAGHGAHEHGDDGGHDHGVHTIEGGDP